MEGWQIALFTAIPTILGPVCCYFGVRSLRRKRLIENVPTSKVEGVFIGLSEVKGQAESRSPLRSYLAEIDCVFYRFDVQEEWRKTETYTDSEGRTRTRTRSGWTTVRSDEVRRPFFLRDDTGSIRVNPASAEIQADQVFSRYCGPWDPIYYGKGPRYSIAYSTHRRRFTEHAIRLASQLYIMGPARLREDVVQPEIRYDRDAELFLISTSSEEQIVRSYGWKSALGITFGLIFLVAAPIAYYMMTNQGTSFGAAVGATLLVNLPIALLYSLTVLLLYLQVVYNGLVDVKNRMEQAFSLIDVQLKRRHDLIPNLVSLVKKFAEHEREVQEEIATMRTEAFRGGAGGLPDEAVALAMAGAANAQTHALSRLFGHVERYPDLKADGSFRKLHEELARTERKIALARTFYNESVKAYNDRLVTMPDMLVGKPLGMKEAVYLKIQEFEKAPIEVRFEADDEPEEQPSTFEDEPLPEGAAPVSDAEAAAQAAKGPGGEG